MPKKMDSCVGMGLGFLMIVVACSDIPDDPIQPRLPTTQPLHSQDVKLESFLGNVGCVRRSGPPKAGDIGLFTGDSFPERYACKNITGGQIRAAVERFRHTQAVGTELASAMLGYMVRHYLGSAEYCWQTTFNTYLGDVLIGVEKVFTGPCHWRHYYWDEWVPYGTGDELPAGGGNGGGPFFSPEDPLGRQPTIDTLPEPDHLCESFAYDTLDGKKGLNWKCLTPLDDTLKAIIWDSLDQYLRPSNQIADTLARRECQTLRHWFNEVRAWDDTNSIAWPVIYKGRTDSISLGSQPHDAQAAGIGSPGAPIPFHVDPKVTIKIGSVPGKKNLLKSLLHEIAHAWGGVDHDTTLSEAQAGYPNSPYFRSLHAAQACIT